MYQETAFPNIVVHSKNVNECFLHAKVLHVVSRRLFVKFQKNIYIL